MKVSYCFYVGSRFITEVIAESEEKAWTKAYALHEMNPYICPCPAGKAIKASEL